MYTITGIKSLNVMDFGFHLVLLGTPGVSFGALFGMLFRLLGLSKPLLAFPGSFLVVFWGFLESF